ncbi:MAG: hypothetical protein HQL30_07690 [Candidatus Omnitrophica bacterium]|nr:hypothetical protein [Candidatus Omnitrophota bacterium]
MKKYQGLYLTNNCLLGILHFNMTGQTMMKRKIFHRVFVAISICAMILNCIDLPYSGALSPMPGNTQISVRRDMLTDLLSATRIVRQNSPADTALLADNEVNVYFRDNGEIVVSEELKSDDVLLLRAIVRAQVIALLGVWSKSSPYKHKVSREIIASCPDITAKYLSMFAPEKRPAIDSPGFVDGMFASAFELLIPVDQGLLAISELRPEEIAFLEAVRPAVNENREHYFTPIFWEWKAREILIRQAAYYGKIYRKDILGKEKGSAETKPASSPLRLLSDMYRGLMFADSPRSAEEIYAMGRDQRGAGVTLADIEKECSVLSKTGLARRTDEGKFYLAEWVRALDIERFIKYNPALADPLSTAEDILSHGMFPRHMDLGKKTGYRTLRKISSTVKVKPFMVVEGLDRESSEDLVGKLAGMRRHDTMGEGLVVPDGVQRGPGTIVGAIEGALARAADKKCEIYDFRDLARMGNDFSGDVLFKKILARGKDKPELVIIKNVSWNVPGIDKDVLFRIWHACKTDKFTEFGEGLEFEQTFLFIAEPGANMDFKHYFKPGEDRGKDYELGEITFARFDAVGNISFNKRSAWADFILEGQRETMRGLPEPQTGVEPRTKWGFPMDDDIIDPINAQLSPEEIQSAVDIWSYYAKLNLSVTAQLEKMFNTFLLHVSPELREALLRMMHPRGANIEINNVIFACNILLPKLGCPDVCAELAKEAGKEVDEMFGASDDPDDFLSLALARELGMSELMVLDPFSPEFLVSGMDAASSAAEYIDKLENMRMPPVKDVLADISTENAGRTKEAIAFRETAEAVMALGAKQLFFRMIKLIPVDTMVELGELTKGLNPVDIIDAGKLVDIENALKDKFTPEKLSREVLPGVSAGYLAMNYVIGKAVLEGLGVTNGESAIARDLMDTIVSYDSSGQIEMRLGIEARAYSIAMAISVSEGISKDEAIKRVKGVAGKIYADIKDVQSSLMSVTDISEASLAERFLWELTSDLESVIQLNEDEALRIVDNKSRDIYPLRARAAAEGWSDALKERLKELWVLRDFISGSEDGVEWNDLLNSVKTLNEKNDRYFDVIGRAEAGAENYYNTGESLILYADDIFDNTMIADLGTAFRNVLRNYRQDILNGGKVYIYGRDPVKTEILVRFIRLFSPDTATVTVTSAELSEGRRHLAGEAEVMEALVRKVRSEISSTGGRLLGVIRDTGDEPEKLAKMAGELKVPVVLVGADNRGGSRSIYSLAEAVAAAMNINTNEGRGGWLCILDPVRSIDGDIKVLHDEYLRALKALVAA